MLFENCCNFGLSVAPSSEDPMLSSILRTSSSLTTTEEKKTKRAPPTIYEDAIAMLAGSLIIYFFADLRDMARAREISATLEELSPPLTTDQVMSKIQGNEEALAKRAIDSEDLQQRLEALKSLQQHETGLFDRILQTKATQTTLTHFVDTKAEEEVVHGIVVNESRKRITVIFRGSVTKKDFSQDAKVAQKKVANPVASLVESEEHKTDDMRVHTGFYEYLFHVNAETEKTRLEEIIADVKDTLRKYPGYRLYCCGHSLGGALCTLFGFYAAADDDLIALLNGHPVVVYSIASPYVGNWKFRFAFQHLERTRRIQHLRIANLEDMVTLMPFAAPKLTALSPALSMLRGAGNLYKHCGMRLQMTEKPIGGADQIHSISYPKDHESNDDEYAKEINDAVMAGKSLAQAFYLMMRQDFDTIVKYHSCEEYESRLEQCKSALSTVTLDQLYADKSVVGDILDPDYEPKKMDGSMQRARRAFSYFRRKSKRESSNTVGGSSSSLILET